MSIRLLLNFLLLFIAFSCIERITFDIPQDKPLYVVYGSITDERETHQVSVGLAVDYTYESFLEPAFIPIKDAEVRIIDDKGNAYGLIYSNISEDYVTRDSFAGKYNRKYKVHLILQNGEEIESEWSKLHPPVPLDSISAEKFQYQELKNGIVLDRKGVTIFAHFSDPPDDKNFYYFIWRGVYYLPTPGIAEEFPCWNLESNMDELVIFEDGEAGLNRIKYPVKNVAINRERLGGYRFISTIEQYSIGRETYNFFKSVRENRNQGSIFDEVPAKTKSNIKFVSGDNLATGFFHASSVDLLRMETKEVLQVNGNQECRIPITSGSLAGECASCNRNAVHNRPEGW